MNIRDMIVVGMADYKVAKAPEVLTTLGLGSCVGIALYDPVSKVGGLAHCMLPDSKSVAVNTNPAKYVDSALVKMINEMAAVGAVRSRIRAKVAGGAQMFAFTSTNESMRIGDRNIEATIKYLAALRIPIISQEVGENYGRTVELHTEDGRFVIKSIGKGIKNI